MLYDKFSIRCGDLVKMLFSGIYPSGVSIDGLFLILQIDIDTIHVLTADNEILHLSVYGSDRFKVISRMRDSVKQNNE